MVKQRTYELGTAIKVVTVLSRSSPTSVVITIKDPSNSVMVNEASMTGDTTSIYSYIYQSSTTDSDGTYKIIIDVTHGSYTSRAISEFIMTDKDE